MIVDTINALFQFLAGVMVWIAVADIWSKRAVAGHTILTATFFFVWSLWSLVFFFQLDQWVSLGAAGLTFFAQAGLISSVIYFKRPKCDYRQGASGSTPRLSTSSKSTASPSTP